MQTRTIASQALSEASEQVLVVLMARWAAALWETAPSWVPSLQAPSQVRLKALRLLKVVNE